MKRWLPSLYFVLIIILIIQFFDAYSTELYTKTQSLFITDFLINGKGLSQSKSITYLNSAMIPSYFVGALSPAFRILADVIGRKKMLYINILGLMVGVTICFFAPTFPLFILGNIILIFFYSLDIQNFYVIENFPEKKRATIRGITGAVSAIAAMTIPIFRKIFVTDEYVGWRNIFGVALFIGIFTFILVIPLGETSDFYKIKHSSIEDSPVEKSSLTKNHFLLNCKLYFTTILSDKLLLTLYLSMFLLGLSTAGITFYNEPMIKFSGITENQLNQILIIQPIISCLFILLGGILSDRFGRIKIVSLWLCFSTLGSLILMSGHLLSLPIWIIGISYGTMFGCFWSSNQLITLTILEKSKVKFRGKSSAFIAYINGFGNAIGIALCTIFMNSFSLNQLKLLIAIPGIIIAIFIINKSNKKKVSE